VQLCQAVALQPQLLQTCEVAQAVRQGLQLVAIQRQLAQGAAYMTQAGWQLRVHTGTACLKNS
jgi:hypothetical protein